MLQLSSERPKCYNCGKSGHFKKGCKTANGTVDRPNLNVTKKKPEISNLYNCSDPSFESDPSNEYSLLRLTHVMNSIFLDPSDKFLTQVVNIGIPKQILGFCFPVSKRGYKIGYELTREENLLEAANALTSYRGMQWLAGV